jgi:hypothetical protein
MLRYGIEQLWDAQCHSVEGDELHQLADMICEYEGLCRLYFCYKRWENI